MILESDIEEIYERTKHLDLHDKKILITGSNGFLGRYFERVLSKKFNSKIIGLDNFISSDNSVRHDPIVFSKIKDVINSTGTYAIDITALLFSEFIDNVEKGDYNYIIAANGIASPKYYTQFPLETIMSATTGTKNILDLAKKSEAKILLFSSSEVYSGSNKIPLKEDDNGDVSTMTDRSCYDISKKMAETFMYVYCTKYNVKATTIRPFNFYSGNMNLNDGRVLSNFAGSILDKKPLNIYGDGSQTRSMTYITDAIVGALHALVLGKSNEIYNIGSQEEVSMLELANKIKAAINPEIEINFISKPDHYLTEPLRRQPCIDKAKKDFNFEVKVSLDEGIDRFYKGICS